MTDFRQISEPQARQVLKILVDYCGHHVIDPRDGDSFVRSIVSGCREYRFCGALGFGGKFRNDGNSGNIPHVDCYREDETPARLQMIKTANERLAELFGPLQTIVKIYQGSNGEATKALYDQLDQLGPVGHVAKNLFRACKCSERAKLYKKGRGYKTAAYERKDWSIRNLATALMGPGADLGLSWGWAIDVALQRADDPHHHVLYVDLPTGQVSFHTGTRADGPDYVGQWDGSPRGSSADRICRWCATLLAREAAAGAEVA